MRGYFGIGVEDISKPMNMGNLLRSANAFGASFFFTVNAAFDAEQVALSDTSDAVRHVPLYTYDSVDELMLPRRCKLVGVEFTEESEDLPSFYHPVAAAYILGRERGSLSPAMQARCDALVKIPTKFCVNVGVAGAIVMYDRVLTMGPFAGGRGGGRAIPGPAPAGGRAAPTGAGAGRS